MRSRGRRPPTLARLFFFDREKRYGVAKVCGVRR
jgi:hypothetical protein